MASYVPGPGALWEKFAGLTETDGPQTAGPFNEFFTGPALLCGERFGAFPPPLNQELTRTPKYKYGFLRGCYDDSARKAVVMTAVVKGVAPVLGHNMITMLKKTVTAVTLCVCF